MKTPPLKELDYFVAWFLFFLCATVGGAVAGFIGGALIGGILGAAGTKPEVIRAAGGVVGFIMAMPVSYLVFRFMVAKFIVSKLESATSVPPPLQSYASPSQ